MNEAIRKLDGLGRIVIPKEYRKELRINDDSKVKLSLKDNCIIIEKYSDISNNLDVLLKYQKILSKEMELDILVTDLDTIISKKVDLNNEVIDKIKYGKIEVINNIRDILFESDKVINIIIIPIILYGEIIGSIIGYSYDREIDEFDKQIFSIIQLILIKNIEE